jgi:hypothetical protein
LDSPLFEWDFEVDHILVILFTTGGSSWKRVSEFKRIKKPIWAPPIWELDKSLEIETEFFYIRKLALWHLAFAKAAQNKDP